MHKYTLVRMVYDYLQQNDPTYRLCARADGLKALRTKNPNKRDMQIVYTGREVLDCLVLLGRDVAKEKEAQNVRTI